MELSQLAIDIIGYISFGFIWLPLICSLLFLCGFIVFVCIQDVHLERDYLRKLTNDERKIIDEYKENTSYIRIKRRLRRIKRNLNSK